MRKSTYYTKNSRSNIKFRGFPGLQYSRSFPGFPGEWEPCEIIRPTTQSESNTTSTFGTSLNIFAVVYLTSSVATNSENFFFSCDSKYHSSTRLSCESRLPDDKLCSSINGCCTQQQTQPTSAHLFTANRRHHSVDSLANI